MIPGSRERKPLHRRVAAEGEWLAEMSSGPAALMGVPVFHYVPPLSPALIVIKVLIIPCRH